MLRVILLFLIVTLVLGFEMRPTDLAWRPLFDGKSSDGWRGFRRARFPAAVWSVEDGMLKRQGRRRGARNQDIITTGQYSDFELEFEWKISPGGNSGVKYLVREDRPPAWDAAALARKRRELEREGKKDSEEYRTMSLEEYRYSPIGFEFQILDDARNGDARNGGHRRTGALYDILGPTSPVAEPAGAFHRGRIVVDGDRVEHWVDGSKVLEFDRGSADFIERIRRSKFAEMSGFGSVRKGHISLQDHGDEVWFRGIRIRELREDRSGDRFLADP